MNVSAVIDIRFQGFFIKIKSTKVRADSILVKTWQIQEPIVSYLLQYRPIWEVANTASTGSSRLILLANAGLLVL